MPVSISLIRSSNRYRRRRAAVLAKFSRLSFTLTAGTRLFRLLFLERLPRIPAFVLIWKIYTSIIEEYLRIIIMRVAASFGICRLGIVRAGLIAAVDIILR